VDLSAPSILDEYWSSGVPTEDPISAILGNGNYTNLPDGDISFTIPPGGQQISITLTDDPANPASGSSDYTSTVTGNLSFSPTSYTPLGDRPTVMDVPRYLMGQPGKGGQLIIFGANLGNAFTYGNSATSAYGSTSTSASTQGNQSTNTGSNPQPSTGTGPQTGTGQPGTTNPVSATTGTTQPTQAAVSQAGTSFTTVTPTTCTPGVNCPTSISQMMCTPGSPGCNVTASTQVCTGGNCGVPTQCTPGTTGCNVTAAGNQVCTNGNCGVPTQCIPDTTGCNVTATSNQACTGGNCGVPTQCTPGTTGCNVTATSNGTCTGAACTNLTTGQSGTVSAVTFCMNNASACGSTTTDPAYQIVIIIYLNALNARNNSSDPIAPALASADATTTTTSSGTVELAAELASITSTDALSSFPGGTAESTGPLLPPASTNDSPAISIVSGGNGGALPFQMQMLDPSGTVKDIAAPEGTVLQPIKRDVANKQKLAAAAGANAAGHMLTQQLSAMCLEFLKLPPPAGMLYRIADQALQDKYKPLLPLLRAGREAAAQGKLHPDSDPNEYAKSILQYAIWSWLGKWDQQQFAQMLVERTKKNAEAMHVKWTKEMEQALFSLAPRRWADISQVFQLAQQLSQQQSAGTP